MFARDTAQQQELPAAEHRQAQLGVHGLWRDAETLRNLAVREAVEAAENEDFPAARWKRGDGFVEDGELLFMGGGFGGIGPILHHGQLLNIPYGLRRGGAVVAELVDGGIACRGKKIRPYLAELPGDLHSEQPGVGLLDEVVEVA